MTVLAHGRSVEIDSREGRCAGWVSYKGKTCNVQITPEEQVHGKKRGREGGLVAETLSQVNDSESCKRMTVNDAQKTARLTLIEHQSDYSNSRIVDNDENQDEPAEESA